MAPPSKLREQARAFKKRVFSKKNTHTVGLDSPGSSSAAAVAKEAVGRRNSNIAAGPSVAVLEEERPPNSTVARSVDIPAAVGAELPPSTSIQRLGLSSGIMALQIDIPTGGSQSLDRVSSVMCCDGSDQVQPIPTDIGSHHSQKEEPLPPVESTLESPCMKLAIQSLEDKEGYEQLTKYIDQLGAEGAEQIISQFATVISQKLDPEAQQSTSILGMKVRRLLPVLGYAKPLVTSIAKLDPHQIAPWVCAGVFFCLEVIFLPHFYYCFSTYRSTLLTMKSDWTGVSQSGNSVDYSRYPF